MTFAADPLSLALALGLLGPAAVDDRGLFDEDEPRDAQRDELIQALAASIDGERDGSTIRIPMDKR